MAIRNHTSTIINSALDTIAVSGFVGLGIIAPNSTVALEKLLNKYLDSKDRSRESKRIAVYMKQQKLVAVSPNTDGSYTVTLTDKGKSRNTIARLDSLKIPNKAWDKKWRIVMFDIPEKHKRLRDYISYHLRKIGFKPLQRSVLIFPYPIDDFVALLKDTFPELKNYLIYLETDNLDAHNKYVKLFANIL